MSSDEQRRATETGMTAARAREILESYGGRSALWPETERAALFSRIEDDKALVEVQETEEALDRILATLEAPEWPQALVADRILGDFDAQSIRNARRIRVRVRALGERLGHAVWPGVPLWRPVAAVGLSILFGLTIGALVPATQTQETDVTVATSPLDMNASLDSIELI